MRRYFIAIYLFFNLICVGQEIKFPDTPIMTLKGDTTIYELTNSLAYNYFTQKFDSTFILVFKKKEYYQIAAINNVNHCGYFKIFYKNILLCQFEIRENKIAGIGTRFFILENKKIASHSMFKNNLLHGITIFYDNQGNIESIVKYKRGRYKQYIYHRLSINEKVLKYGNKKAHDPFLQVFRMSFN